MNRERTTKQTISPEGFAESKPAPDEATVRMCIERIKEKGAGWTGEYADGLAEAVEALKHLLPTPEPPLPTQYRELAGADYPTLEVVSLDTIKRRHGLLTPEEAFGAVIVACPSLADTADAEDILAALRLAAKGGPTT